MHDYSWVVENVQLLDLRTFTQVKQYVILRTTQ